MARTLNLKKIISAAQNILLKNNRFAPTAEKSFVNTNTTANQMDGKSITKVQVKYGDYKALGPEEEIVFSNLKKIGASLLLKSAGFDTSSSPGSSKDPTNFTPTQIAAGMNSTDSRVNTRRLRARNAKGAPLNSYGQNLQDSEGLDGPYGGKGEFFSSNQKSFGTTFITTNAF